MSRVVGIVLAAGASRRLGRPKQLLPLGGRPLLQHALDAAAAAGLAEILLVLGHEAEAITRAVRLPPRGRIVVNPEWAAGQATSLRCGLRAAPADADAAAVLLGDQPGLGSAVVARVVAAFEACGAPVARPVWRDPAGGAHPGHPVVLGRAIWPELLALEGDRGARELLARHPAWMHEVAIAGAPPADVDDDDDYRAAVAAFAAVR